MLSAWPWASCSTRWLSCVHASTDVPVTSLLETHPDILHHTTGHIEELLRVIGDMFHCEEDIDTIANVMLSCRRRNWHTQQPAALHHKFTYFCNYVGVDDKGMKRAWKNGVFVVPPVKLDMRLACMAEQLGATIDEAKSVVRAFPQTCGLLPATSELHIMQLHDLGFSGSQVKSMCLRQPVLLAYSYNSEVHVAKWLFLTCVLRLSHDAIAAKPHLLMSSLPNRLGPRWAYLRQLRLVPTKLLAALHLTLMLSSEQSILHHTSVPMTMIFSSSGRIDGNLCLFTSSSASKTLLITLTCCKFL